MPFTCNYYRIMYSYPVCVLRSQFSCGLMGPQRSLRILIRTSSPTNAQFILIFVTHSLSFTHPSFLILCHLQVSSYFPSLVPPAGSSLLPFSSTLLYSPIIFPLKSPLFLFSYHLFFSSPYCSFSLLGDSMCPDQEIYCHFKETEANL